jgi:hypothetical protein
MHLLMANTFGIHYGKLIGLAMLKKWQKAM